MKYRNIEEFEREMDRRDARRTYGFEREGMSHEEMQERRDAREADDAKFWENPPKE